MDELNKSDEDLGLEFDIKIMAINECDHLNDVKLSVMNFLLMYIANMKFVLLNKGNFC